MDSSIYIFYDDTRDCKQALRELQAILRDHFHAEGRGVIEMVRSIEAQLPPTLLWELRSIGHIRNKIVHDGLDRVPRYFDPLCIEAAATLKLLIAERLPKAVKSSKSAKPTKASTPQKRAGKKTPSTEAAPARPKRATKKTRSR